MKKLAITFVLLGTALGFGAGYWFGGQGSALTEAEEGAVKPLIGRSQGSRVEVAAASAAAGPAAGVPSEDASFKQKSDFLEAMARRDPKAAIAWADANSEEGTRDDLYRAIAAEWAKKDPRAAFAWAQGLSLQDEREDAIRGVVKGALEGGNEAVAMEILGELPPGEYQDAAITAAVAFFADRDLEKAIGLAALMGNTYAMRYAGRAMAKSLIESGRFQEVRQRVSELPYGNLRRQLTIGLVEELLKKDAKAAMAWIAEKPMGPDGEQIFDSNTVRSLGYSMGRAMVKQGDPAEAIAWVESLDDEQVKRYYSEAIGKSWAQRFPEEAGDWLIDAIESEGIESLGKVAEGIFDEWVEVDQRAPFEMIAEISDPEVRTKAALMAVSKLAYENPRTAAEQLVIWGSTDPEKAAGLSSQIMSHWMRRDAEQASRWLSEQPGGPIKDRGIEQLVRSVLREDRDVDTARAWMVELQDPVLHERLTQELKRYEGDPFRARATGKGGG